MSLVRTFLQAFVILALIASLTACSDNDSNSAAPNIVPSSAADEAFTGASPALPGVPRGAGQNVDIEPGTALGQGKVYMGNPENIYKGTTTDPTIHLQAFEDVRRVYLTKTVSFKSIQTINTKGTESQGSHEADSHSNSEKHFYKFKVEVDEGDLVLTSRDKDLEKNTLRIGAVQTEHGLQAQFEETPEVDVQLIHFSESEDGKHFSLLLRIQDDEMVEVAAYYFSFSEAFGPYRRGDNTYEYLRGNGIKTRWDKSKTLSIKYPGLQFDFLLQLDANKAVEEWQAALGESLKIESQFIDDAGYKPFSDLQTHAFYFVNDFKVLPSDRAAKYGEAVVIDDYSNHHFVDADAFIFAEELSKTGIGIFDVRLKELIWQVFLHETGHLLGLHHVFDGRMSIMSYEFNTDSLTNYDKAAVKELYSN